MLQHHLQTLIEKAHLLPLVEIKAASVTGMITLAGVLVDPANWDKWGLPGMAIGVVLWQGWKREQRMADRLDILENQQLSLLREAVVVMSKLESKLGMAKQEGGE